MHEIHTFAAIWKLILACEVEMTGVTINMNVAAPYVSLKEYSRLTGIPFDTCRLMVRDGRIIIRPKELSGGKVEVNMIAMLKDAIANS